MPLVSVIIPVYNRPFFIKEAMISVLNQTYKNYELLVYDDGSTDNTPKVIEKVINFYKSSNIKFYRHQKKMGPSFARNKAVSFANGEYIAFLDSDDLWFKNKLITQIKYMLENSWDICQTDEIWIRNNKKVNPQKKHEKISGYIFEKSLDLCIVSPSAVMIKKSFFIAMGGFDESLPACEDYDLWLRISYAHEIHLIPKKLVIKRGGHGDQLSKNVPCLDKYRIYSIQKILNNCNLSSHQKTIAFQKLKEKCKIYATGLKKRGKNDEAEIYEKLPETLLYRDRF